MGDYIPANIRAAGVYPSYLKGYSLVFRAVAIVLDKQPAMSKESFARQIQKAEYRDSQYIQNYFNKGGTIDHVLAAIVHRSWEEVKFFLFLFPF